MTILLSIVLSFMLAGTGGQAQSGVVSGIVRDAAGNPQSGVRVAAMAVTPSDDTRKTDVLVSIAKTDESGRYSLEIPQGRYYVVAGRVNSPTYYPEATHSDRAVVFSITPGSKTEGIDFKVFVLSGVVRDSAGKPQWGARVAAMDANHPMGCLNDLSIETETDSNGRYSLQVLPNEYAIVAQIPGRTRFYPKADSRENSMRVVVKDGVTSGELDIEVPVETALFEGKQLERDLYLAALENVRLGCHSAARLQLQTLIGSYPSSQYAGEARYEMAESYFREGSPSPTAMADAMRWFSDYVRLTPDAAHVSQARQRLLEIQKKLPR
jgi:hypothetical protein